MEKIKYILEVISSFFKDLTSWSKVYKNKWHLHIPIGIASIFLTNFILHKYAFVNEEAMWFQYFVPIFILFSACWAFERIQGMYAEYKGKDRPEQFGSDKDVIAGTLIPAILLIVLKYTLCL